MLSLTKPWCLLVWGQHLRMLATLSWLKTLVSRHEAVTSGGGRVEAVFFSPMISNVNCVVFHCINSLQLTFVAFQHNGQTDETTVLGE